MGAKSISRVDAAVLQEAVDREPFQQIEAIASRSQSPTSATKSAHSDCQPNVRLEGVDRTSSRAAINVRVGVRIKFFPHDSNGARLIKHEETGSCYRNFPPHRKLRKRAPNDTG
jgi:hypothetical protein